MNVDVILDQISLQEAVDFVVDNRGRTAPTENVGIPLIATNCVSNDNLYPTAERLRYVSQDTYDNWFRAHPKPGDILLTNKGSQNGAVCLVPDPVNFCIAQDMVALRANSQKIYPLYLFAALRSQLVQKRIKGLNVDAVIPHFKKTDFDKLFLPLPSRPYQEFIGNLHFKLIYKIELNSQINQTLEEMAQAIFKSWFVDFEPVKAKIEAKANGQNPERAAMCAISGKSDDELVQLLPAQLAQLQATAALFPDELTDSELGLIPQGWVVSNVGNIVKRLKPKKRYTKKQIVEYGSVPVFEQGASILLGYHNDEPGFNATPEKPLFIFGDHTCVFYLSCAPFDISQNVIPLAGNNHPTLWVYYAVKDKQEFQEYRRHWSELIIKKIVEPNVELSQLFSETVTKLYQKKEQSVEQNNTLNQLRDTLLPKLLSGEIELTQTD